MLCLHPKTGGKLEEINQYADHKTNLNIDERRNKNNE